MNYIDAQLKMAADTETLMAAEGKQLDKIEAYQGFPLHDYQTAEYDRLKDNVKLLLKIASQALAKAGEDT